MARQRTVTVGALNIRVHPHSVELYRSLLFDAFRLKKAIKVFGPQRVILERVDRRQDEAGFISGSLARFTEIDPNQAWFNADRFERADDNEVARVSIPAELRPNYVSIAFKFNLNRHLLVFQTRGTSGSFSSKSAFLFFDTILNSEEITQKYGSVLVSLVSDHESLSGIMSLYRIRKLEILVKRPNPDDHADYDSFIEERLQSQRAASVRVLYNASANESIEPDKATRALAESATRNGYVRTIGNDEAGNRVVQSTEDHPALESARYNPDLLTENEAFGLAASKLSEGIARDRLR